MSGWEEAAETYAAARQRADRAAELRRQEAANAQAAKEARAQQEADEMAAAMAEAVVGLSAYLRQKGEAAQRLLAARPNSVVRFGSDSEGGFFSGVYFGLNGLMKEAGRSGSIYGSTPAEFDTVPCSVEEAVHYYAYYGSGQGDTAAVRDLPRWFEQQLDEMAAFMRKEADRLRRQAEQP